MPLSNCFVVIRTTANIRLPKYGCRECDSPSCTHARDRMTWTRAGPQTAAELRHVRQANVGSPSRFMPAEQAPGYATGIAPRWQTSSSAGPACHHMQCGAMRRQCSCDVHAVCVSVTMTLVIGYIRKGRLRGTRRQCRSVTVSSSSAHASALAMH